jgi:site-specific DNA-methyltransferase (adenine-specific)/site-specific DNA-methyltransferase (cytosine-N4-specific)
MCADCRHPAAWQRLLAAAGVGQVAGIFTSPPYAQQRKGHYGGVPAGEFVNWFEAVQELAAAHLHPAGSFFLNIRAHTAGGARELYVYDLVLAMCRLWDWQLVDDLVWLRQGFPGRFRNRFKNAWEPVFHFAKTTDCVFRPEHVTRPLDPAGSSFSTYETGRDMTMGAGYAGETGRNVRAAGLEGALPSNVVTALTGSQDPTAVSYGATFPAALPGFFLPAYSDPGAVWLDPFAGSGTVAVAAEETGRVALLIDQNPAAIALTLKRLAGLGLEVTRCT